MDPDMDDEAVAEQFYGIAENLEEGPAPDQRWVLIPVFLFSSFFVLCAVVGFIDVVKWAVTK